jgi:hypothetical protein
MNFPTSTPNLDRVARRSTTGLRHSSTGRLLAGGLLCVVVAACGGSANSASSSAAAGTSSAGSSDAPTETGAPSASATADLSAVPGESQAPDTGGSAAAGDVPDNAVFLTYQQASLGFSIQYVEGWQVTTQPDGVVIHDKDSSETVTVAALPIDVAAYISSTDLPSLQSQAGYRLVKQDAIKVGSSTDHHVVYHILSPADPVTGKQVPSTVDRYYVPGTSQLAIVSLSTPDGVDNVDAFRQMIGSFRWK